MALQHAASGDKIALSRGDDDIAFFTSVALAKTPHMELIRLVLPKERPMPVHKVDGEITLQCLEGEIEVDAHDHLTLKPGEMLYLAGGVPHAVRAVEDAVALMTILLTTAGRRADATAAMACRYRPRTQHCPVAVCDERRRTSLRETHAARAISISLRRADRAPAAAPPSPSDRRHRTARRPPHW